MSAPTTEKPKPQPEAEEYEFLLESKPVWRDLLDQIKELFSPEKQPELVLESKPIPVKDIWSPPKSLRSRMGSAAVHVVVIVALIFLIRPVAKQVQALVTTPIFVPPPQVQPVMPKIRRLSGGGAPVIARPEVVQAPHPQPLSAPTSMVPLADALSAASFGSVGPVSGPPGVDGGSGGGPGGNGSGDAGGTCVGSDCGDAGSVVSDPVPIYQPEAEFTDAARKAKFQGTCIVSVTIGSDGRVRNPHVVQPLGLGLDENAVQAVLKWRFQPARDKTGKAIAVAANVEVSFRLY